VVQSGRATERARAKPLERRRRRDIGPVRQLAHELRERLLRCAGRKPPLCAVMRAPAGAPTQKRHTKPILTDFNLNAPGGPGHLSGDFGRAAYGLFVLSVR
jgi:hypothetical protein